MFRGTILASASRGTTVESNEGSLKGEKSTGTKNNHRTILRKTKKTGTPGILKLPNMKRSVGENTNMMSG